MNQAPCGSRAAPVRNLRAALARRPNYVRRRKQLSSRCRRVARAAASNLGPPAGGSSTAPMATFASAAAAADTEPVGGANTLGRSRRRHLSTSRANCDLSLDLLRVATIAPICGGARLLRHWRRRRRRRATAISTIGELAISSPRWQVCRADARSAFSARDAARGQVRANRFCLQTARPLRPESLI